ncbi:flavodoxin family protein [Candidatus Hydrogenedentota bacterium]
MHALIINGSPRRDGSTGRLCKHFARGLIDLAGTASIVCLRDMQIEYCGGCDACLDTGECVIDDGMLGLVSQILTCDILVLASPSYWGYVTAQMKTFIDRSRPLCEHVSRERAGNCKRGISIAVRAGSGVSENLCLVRCFEHYFGHLGIKPAGQLTIENVSAPQDLTEGHAQRAYELGRMIGSQQINGEKV